jgi:chromate transporter
MQASGFSMDNVVVLMVTIILLLTKKVPAPLIVLASLILGLVL